MSKLDSLGVPTGSERERILNIASIAEAEVGSEKYYGQVARVILNRLDADMALGMDTTVAYGLGISASQLTDDQLGDDSNAYNTRIHKGLPPTPISNPGDGAIHSSRQSSGRQVAVLCHHKPADRRNEIRGNRR